MLDKDVVLAKVASIDRCLARIERVTGGRSASLDEIDIQDIVVLNLLRAVQSAIDLANHLLTDTPSGLPTSLKETFRLLVNAAELQPELGKRLESMVGFRNIAVHEYQTLDPQILKSIVERHLDDLREFSRIALERAGIAND